MGGEGGPEEEGRQEEDEGVHVRIMMVGTATGDSQGPLVLWSEVWKKRGPVLRRVIFRCRRGRSEPMRKLLFAKVLH